MSARGMYTPRAPAAGGDNSTPAPVQDYVLSSTPIPPTAANSGNLAIFDVALGSIGWLRRDVKGHFRGDAEVFQPQPCGRTCAPRKQRGGTAGGTSVTPRQGCETVRTPVRNGGAARAEHWGRPCGTVGRRCGTLGPPVRNIGAARAEQWGRQCGTVGRGCGTVGLPVRNSGTRVRNSGTRVRNSGTRVPNGGTRVRKVGTPSSRRRDQGYRDEEAKEKKSTMETYWVPRVNNRRDWGRRAFIELTDVWEIGREFAAISRAGRRQRTPTGKRRGRRLTRCPPPVSRSSSAACRGVSEVRANLKTFLLGDAFLRRFIAEVFLFEELPAGDRHADEVYLDEASRCDIYLGIFGNDSAVSA